MLKRLGVALAALFSFVTIANAAGTVPGFSLTPQFDLTGKVAPGCKLYVIRAGTVSTPQSAYSDTALTIALPNPLTCDAGGRLPQWFVADGSIKLRLTTSVGVQIFSQDNLLVVGPSSGGGGGGGSVDPTTIAATGDIKSAYGTSVISGWVRANGRTIGNATSGATERANADTAALFSYLWTTDLGLAVSGGRGASAALDFAANKTIALPDFRGRVLASFDDMGNSAAGRLTTATMNGTGIGAVSLSGQQATLSTLNLPPFTPAGSLSLSTSVSTSVTTTITGGSATVNSTNFVASNASDATPLSAAAGGAVGGVAAAGVTVAHIQSTGSITGTASSSASSTATPSGSFIGTAQGGTSTPFSIVQPTIFVTSYIKL
ncbi:hypothetical protein JQ633_01085 [Bradyrhizobium tropiciagri]|uniref:hypothetical protein n=1 Tax=Bradyrhizobium tropiciagri TaxID=312253 RepID=UPI001BA9EDC5|nr:hypothetical protein [Bradyrhizobium tropiciagri]MBR0868935.1 hypothetical protein [Bradyrhizobium tropiciagri]